MTILRTTPSHDRFWQRIAGAAKWVTLKRSAITIYNDIYEEHLFVFAAGLSYYFVLSLFPLLVSMASMLGYVPIPHLFEGLLSLMARLVPGDGMSLVRNIVSDVSNKHRPFLTLGLVFTIWTASSGFAAIIDGLDLVYRVRETRPVWKTRPIALGLTLLAGSLLVVAVGLMVEGTYVGTWFTGRFDLNPAVLGVWRYLRGGIATAFAILAVELLYHFGPDVKQRFRDSLPGAIVAVAAWIALSFLLGIYFRDFESLDKTYGPLGAAIGLYVWFYLSGFAILIGGRDQLSVWPTAKPQPLRIVLIGDCQSPGPSRSFDRSGSSYSFWSVPSVQGTREPVMWRQRT
jgi:membrane protein